MLHLYLGNTDYCLADPTTFKVSYWSLSPQEAIESFFNLTDYPYPEHTCFTDNDDYALVGTYTCTTLKEFYDNYPELFI
jgi:hypothetical protein